MTKEALIALGLSPERAVRVLLVAKAGGIHPQTSLLANVEDKGPEREHVPKQHAVTLILLRGGKHSKTPQHSTGQSKP